MPHKDPEARRVYYAAWYARNREDKIQKMRVYNHAHMDAFVASNKRRREQDPDKYAEIDLRYRTKNKKKIVARSRRYYTNNKAKVRLNGRRYKMRKRAVAISDLTEEQWQIILTVFKHRCAYCPSTCWRCRKKKHVLTQDHVTPLSRGGPDTMSNVVPACRSCNSRKYNRSAPVAVQPLLL